MDEWAFHAVKDLWHEEVSHIFTVMKDFEDSPDCECRFLIDYDHGSRVLTMMHDANTVDEFLYRLEAIYTSVCYDLDMVIEDGDPEAISSARLTKRRYKALISKILTSMEDHGVPLGQWDTLKADLNSYY